MRDNVERYCIRELHRMYDAHRRMADILYDLADQANQGLLATTLREQVAANTWCLERLEQVFDHLEIEVEESPNAEVAVMVLEAESSEDEPDPAVRDMMIAQSAIRLEHYAIANYAGLASWFQQLGHHEVGRAIDAMLARLRMAEEHLEALQPTLSDLFEDEPRDYRTPHVARPREREPRSDLDSFER